MLRTLLIGSAALVCAACNAANYTSVYRQPDLAGSDRSLVLDAEQSLVINRGGTTCVAPSPDAISSAATSSGILGEVFGRGNVSASSSASNSVSYVGLRTQSIQLLREALFALCLEAQNGNLDDFNSSIMMRRYQSQLVAVLAIEQLTGAVTAGGGATASGGQASPGDPIGTVVQANQTIAARQSQIQTRLNEIDVELAGSPDAQQAASLNAEQDQLQTEQANLTSATTELNSALENLQSGQSATAGAAISRAAQFAPNVFENGDDDAVIAVAAAVQGIVDSVVGADHSATLCFEHYRSGAPTPAPLQAFCQTTLQRAADPVMHRVMDLYLAAMANGRIAEASELRSMLAMLAGSSDQATSGLPTSTLDGPTVMYTPSMADQLDTPVGVAAPD